MNSLSFTLLLFAAIVFWKVNALIPVAPLVEPIQFDMTPLLILGATGTALITAGLSFTRDEPDVAVPSKSFLFDDLLNQAELPSTPEYLISAILSGLNILPKETELMKGSQRGRRVQYKV